MFKYISKNFSKFFKLDLRWKLIKLTKFFNIKFYPDFFYRKGIKGLYSRVMIHFLLNSQLKEIKKIITNDFLNYDDDKINFLISSPSSGSNFLRNMLQSYFELFYQIGNGIPKHDNINARYFFAGTQINSGELYNQVLIFNHLIDKNKILNKENFNKKKIIFSRYPLQRIDLYKLEQIKPVILFRSPFDEITSTYIKDDRRAPEIKTKEVNFDLLKFKIKNYEKYISFWAYFSKKEENKKKFLAINYEDLIKNSDQILKKILIFYNYEINDEFLKKSLIIHTKENTNKNIYGPKIYNRTRFTNTKIKEDQQKIIKKTFEEILSTTNIVEDYNHLKGLSSIDEV